MTAVPEAVFKTSWKRIHIELGVTIIHITHDLTEAFFLADQLAVIENGKILQVGSPEEVCMHPRDRSVAELVGIENMIEATVESSRLRTVIGDLDLIELFLPIEMIRPRGSF